MLWVMHKALLQGYTSGRLSGLYSWFIFLDNNAFRQYPNCAFLPVRVGFTGMDKRSMTRLNGRRF